MDNRLEKKQADQISMVQAAEPREIYLFGAIALDSTPEGSGINLAESGLPPAGLFESVGKIAEALGPEVELLDLEEDTSVTPYLKTEGELKRVAQAGETS